MKQEHKKQIKWLSIFAGIGLLAAVCYFAGKPQAGENPHKMVLFNEKAKETLCTLTRVDTEGMLYSIEYTAEYHSLESQALFAALRMFRKVGCSAFTTSDENGDVLTCRNYDYPHLDEEGNPTRLNVVVRCTPENGYRSIGITDALIFNEIGCQYQPGSLDDGETDISLMMLLPWLCMDGINEKGLSVSILYVPGKTGETPVNQNEDGLEKVLVTQLLRMMLDSCANVEEAIKLAGNVNLVNLLGHDYHLFVTDKTGHSVVLEWRYQILTVVETDAVTNFYQSYNVRGIPATMTGHCVRNGQALQKLKKHINMDLGMGMSGSKPWSAHWTEESDFPGVRHGI